MMILLLRQCQDGYPPETSIKIGGESLNVTSWSQLIQVPLLSGFGMWLPKLSASHSHFFPCVFFLFSVTVELFKAFSWGRFCQAHAGSVSYS